MTWEIRRAFNSNSRPKNLSKFFYSHRKVALISRISFHSYILRQRCVRSNTTWLKESQKRWKILIFLRKISRTSLKKYKNSKSPKRRKASPTSWLTRAKNVIFATKPSSAKNSTYFRVDTHCTAFASFVCSSATKLLMHLSWEAVTECARLSEKFPTFTCQSRMIRNLCRSDMLASRKSRP